MTRPLAVANFIGALLSVAALTGCPLGSDFDGYGRSAGAAGSGAQGAGGGAAGSPDGGGTGATGGVAACPSGLPGPPLVLVPAPSGSPVSSYCVDATEVTNAQYAVFLAAPPAAQGPACGWAGTHIPSSGWPATSKGDYPVVYVNWCDAFAYCKWAKKRLCGRVGGGANSFGDFADATKSEWYNACSGGGTKTFPYGVAYEAKRCVGNEYATTNVARSVGSATGCEGAYPGLFDLSGNVREWEDSCNGTTGASDKCRVRGGSFDVPAYALECGYGTSASQPSYVYPSRSYQSASIGFRCCAD